VRVRARELYWAGLRLGLPYGAVGFLLSMSFAVLAGQAGFSAAQTIVMSLVVFAGSAQFAALGVLASGGTAVAAVTAGALLNSRFLAMGLAVAPYAKGHAVARGAQGQLIVDSTWALAHREEGPFDRWMMLGNTSVQFMTWQLGSLAGVLAGDALGDIDRFGLDAIFPTFFLALLVSELRNRRSRVVALLGAVIALALVPFAPPGVPILAAAAAALVGVRR
jgi:4-azaleucine resistance transporter AzlC